MTFRAVIYARCSTEEESQKDALVKQVVEAKECVLQNGWTLVRVFNVKVYHTNVFGFLSIPENYFGIGF